MTVEIEPGLLTGPVSIPPSKSMMQRACAAALLHRGTTLIRHPGHSADELAALDIIRACGAVVGEQPDGSLLIQSKGVAPAGNRIHCGESGLAARLFTPIVALYNKEITVDGSGSLLQRPMQLFSDLLPQLGVSVAAANGHLPLRVHGPLQAKSTTLDGTLSSQFISGLLFAFSEAAQQPVSLQVRNPVSIPYLALTLQTLEQMGRPVQHHADYTEFSIDPASFREPELLDLTIESDWSSAAPWIAAACMGHPVILQGLEEQSLQADKAILKVVHQTGASLHREKDQLRLTASTLPQAFVFDATDCPDLFPVLAVLAGACVGQSRIRGVQRLEHKESNRAQSIAQMLEQLGVPFSISDDMLFITGVPLFRVGIIDSFNDHRLVMAAALAATRCAGPLRIVRAEAIRKSYPAFFGHLSAAGLQWREIVH